MAMRALAVLRSSFGLKLLAALLASVGVVLLLALVVVRRETERQVERVAERMAARSREAFRELDELKRVELERLGSAFTESRRTLAAVEAAAEPAVREAELEWLIQTVRYELELKRMPHSLVAFTDADARPLLTLRDGDIVTGDDPADLAAPARRLLETGADRLDAYRALGGELFALQARPLGLAGTTVGTVALGVPVDDAEARRVADVLGVELCFVLAGECLAGTPTARALLGTLLRAADDDRVAPVAAGGERWRVLAEDLSPDQPGMARRIVGVPMNEVLAPFERIRGALGVAGAVALGFAVLLGAVLTRELTGPVRDLVAATSRVAGGDLAARVPVRSGDELGRLASAFNTMTEGLELKERYRGVLDKVVSPEVAQELLRSDILLGGETREVTTLFVDISSFTAMTEGMEPQRVVAFVNDIMSRLGTVVEAHGGVVDKYLGDGLMALFGAPVGRGDDATRAVRAALDMQRAMTALDAPRAARGEPPVRVAVGIHTGPVVAGNIGSPNRLNYTAVGESVNLAARLCQGAGAGVILVTHEVRTRARGEFAFECVGERAFKGFSRAVEVFAVHENATAAASSTEGAK